MKKEGNIPTLRWQKKPALYDKNFLKLLFYLLIYSGQKLHISQNRFKSLVILVTLPSILLAFTAQHPHSLVCLFFF